MDYDELRTGMRREATYSNIMQFCNWFMSVLSITLPFAVLSILGFDADRRQSVFEISTIFHQIVTWSQERVIDGLSYLVGSAGLFSLVAAILLFFYPISKQKYHAILNAIAAHKAVSTSVSCVLVSLVVELIQIDNF